MMKIEELHEELYQYLETERLSNPDFRYSLRRNNIGGKLSDGYWFEGNEDFVVVSFWSAWNPIAKLPVIGFVIDKKLNSRLIVDCSQMTRIASFMNEIKSFLDFGFSDFERGKYEKGFYGDDWRRNLEQFLIKEKKVIDVQAERYFKKNDSDSADIIRPFKAIEFKSMLREVERKRNEKLKLDEELSAVDKEKPSKLNYLMIKNYGLIKSVEMDFGSSQWIFFTGENGSGKTHLLRAIATYLGSRLLPRKEINKDEAFKVISNFKWKDSNWSYNRDNNSRNGERIRFNSQPVISGLAMYGPFRLTAITTRLDRSSFYKKMRQPGYFDSLFKPGTKLLSLEKQFQLWSSSSISNEKRLFEKRKFSIARVLAGVVPNLVDVEFGSQAKEKTNYIFIDAMGIRSSLHWNQLSSGNTSMLAMVGDILIRLYYRQKEIIDASQLKGIVMIDEIDLHLHPKGQKELVMKLSEVFPDVQFLVSTHSPIPMLGAPKDSKFFTTRIEDSSLIVEPIDIDVSQLLPNTILSSPIFGFNDMASPEYDEMNMLKTEDNYSESVFYSILEKKVQRDIDRLNNEED